MSNKIPAPIVEPPPLRIGLAARQVHPVWIWLAALLLSCFAFVWYTLKLEKETKPLPPPATTVRITFQSGARVTVDIKPGEDLLFGTDQTFRIGKRNVYYVGIAKIELYATPKEGQGVRLKPGEEIVK